MFVLIYFFIISFTYSMYFDHIDPFIQSYHLLHHESYCSPQLFSVPLNHHHSIMSLFRHNSYKINLHFCSLRLSYMFDTYCLKYIYLWILSHSLSFPSSYHPIHSLPSLFSPPIKAGHPWVSTKHGISSFNKTKHLHMYIKAGQVDPVRETES